MAQGKVNSQTMIENVKSQTRIERGKSADQLEKGKVNKRLAEGIAQDKAIATGKGTRPGSRQ